MIWAFEDIGMQMFPLFAWQYVRLTFNDETGVVGNEAVPGKELPTLPCLSSYRKNNRRTYSKDGTGVPLIFQVCNLETHTLYKVYTQDCAPYAVVDTIEDSVECGFGLPPLVGEGVPPLPFHVPPYGEYRTFDYCDYLGNEKHILIERKNYSGDVEVIDFGTQTVVSYEINNNGDELHGIRATTANIGFIATVDFDFSQLYSSDEREFRYTITGERGIEFKGFGIPDSNAEPFNAPPYGVNIRVTDCIGGLKNATYPIPIGAAATLRQRLLNVLCYCLYMTGLDLEINTMVNLYEVKMTTGQNDDPLFMAKINPLVFGDQKGQIDDCYAVLEHLCNTFRATLKQENGQWRFVRVPEMGKGSTRQRVYDYTGLFLRSEINTTQKVVGRFEDIELLAGSEKNIHNAYKRVEVLVDYGDVPSVLFNGDFEQWDGSNFNFWTKYGGIDVSRVERSVRGSQGIIGLENYALQFNQFAEATKWIQHDPIPVLAGDRINFKFLTGPMVPANISLRVRFQIGPYCLYNDPNLNNPQAYEWVQQLATSTLFVMANNNPVITTVSLPECPISGDLKISIFGFRSARNFWIDNVGITKSSNNGKYDVTGSLAISEQLNYYTDRPEMLTIPIGDYDPTREFLLSNQTVPPTATSNPYVQNNMYAIYTSDGSYSTLWAEYGASGIGVPLNLANARAGLRMNQRPYIFLRNFAISGSGLGFFDVYNIKVPGTPEFENKDFIPISGVYDQRTAQFRGTVAELVNVPFQSNDVTTPYFPGQFQTEIVTDPNSIPTLAGLGVFTDEFTQEFV